MRVGHGGFLSWLVVVIDDHEPFAADEGFVHPVEVQVHEITKGTAVEVVGIPGNRFEEAVVKRRVDQHGVIVSAVMVVETSRERVGAGASQPVPELIQAVLVELWKLSRIMVLCEIGEFLLEGVPIAVAEQGFV